MATPVHPSDVSEDEWALLAPSIPPAKPYGRPRSVGMRRVVHGIFSLPREDGLWQTV